MKCSISIQDWQAYFDGRLSREKMDHLEGHLSQCPHCLHLYQQILTNQLSRLEDQYGPHIDLADEIMLQINEEKQRKPVPRSIIGMKTWLHYGVAACLALILLGSGAFHQAVDYTHQSHFMLQKTERWIVESKTKADDWLESILSDAFIKQIGGKTSHEK